MGSESKFKDNNLITGNKSFYENGFISNKITHKTQNQHAIVY